VVRRTSIALVALALGTALVAGCSGGAPAQQGTTGAAGGATPIKIGAIVSLTGSYAGLGTPEKNSIEMEAKRLNDAGGINGKPVEVVFVDDATDPQKAVAAATKLIDQDKVVAIIGATGTGQTMGIRTETDRAGIPVVSMAGGSVITDQFDPNMFQTPWPNRLVVPVTLGYLKSHALTKVALISSSDGYGKDGHDVTVKMAKGSGVTIVGDESFNVGDPDMTAQLTKLKAAKPQAIWLWNAGKDAATVVKNLRQLDPSGSIRLIGAPGNARKEFITGAGDAAEGFTFAAGKILLPETYGAGTPEFKVATDFIDRYTKAYGSPPDIFAGHAYDAFAIVTDALKRASGTSGPELRTAIESTHGLVGIGGTFNYSATDHNGLTEKDLVMYTIVKGAWTLAK
jgi:branched-chain amino acid transport system substrate-binding protein